jgi:hypothetical protein
MRKRSKGRNAEEVKVLLEGFRRSGLTRRAYCQRAGIPVTTLDYYWRQAHPTGSAVRLVRVAVKAAPAEHSQLDSFALVLANGRRIESGWGFREPDLARLIRLAETE